MVIVRYFVLIISLVLWSVVGFVIWIPLLVRITLIFLVAILHGAITNQSSAHAGKHLDKAMSFYFDGFRRMIDAFRSNDVELDGPKTELQIGRLVVELLWAGFVWIVLLGFIVFQSQIRDSVASLTKTKTPQPSSSPLPDPSPALSKVYGINFAPWVYAWFWYEGTTFRVQPLDLSSFTDGRLHLKVSICNIGTSNSGSLRALGIWYAPPDGQRSFNWQFRGVYGLKPNECTSVEGWSSEVHKGFSLHRPFGTLNVAAENGPIFTLNIHEADSKKWIWPWPN